MSEEAIAEFQRAAQLSGGSPTYTANLARAYAAAGKRQEATALPNGLRTRSADVYSDAAEITMVYVALGDKDQAMTWLNRAYEEQFNPGVLLRTGFDPLCSDPRFQDLLRRVRLPL